MRGEKLWAQSNTYHPKLIRKSYGDNMCPKLTKKSSQKNEIPVFFSNKILCIVNCCRSSFGIGFDVGGKIQPLLYGIIMAENWLKKKLWLEIDLAIIS